MESIMNQENAVFLKEMQCLAKNNEKVDLTAWYRLWAWDMSRKLAFGKGYEMMGNGDDKTGYIDMIDAGTEFDGVVSQD
jgi:hypothetical protein